MSCGAERVDEFRDDIDDDGSQPFGAAGSERFRDESAQPIVLPAECQEVLGDPVPQRA
jgi:hypothetical protein